jgi:hypothetical protein|tara:strand:- start:316 stop:669 length:354 start_codon:yes stop_codon:yes gene_type:complete
MVRLGDKTKKALRIGAKVGGIGLALVGAKKSLGQKDDGGAALREIQAKDPNKSNPFMRTIGESRASAPSGVSAPSTKKLVESSGALRSGASDFASMATQMREQQESKSKSGLMRFLG